MEHLDVVLGSCNIHYNYKAPNDHVVEQKTAKCDEHVGQPWGCPASIEYNTCEERGMGRERKERERESEYVCVCDV